MTRPMIRPPNNQRAWIGLIFPLVIFVVLLGAVVAVPLLIISYNSFTQTSSGFCQLTDPLYQAINVNAEGWAAVAQTAGREVRFSVTGDTRGYIFRQHFSGTAQTPVFYVIAAEAAGRREGSQGYIYIRAGALPAYWTEQYVITQISAQIYCYRVAGA